MSQYDKGYSAGFIAGLKEMADIQKETKFNIPPEEKKKIREHIDSVLPDEPTKKEKKVEEISNNALYFDDGSDYKTALYEILSTIRPDLFDEEDGELKNQLEFIDS